MPNSQTQRAIRFPLDFEFLPAGNESSHFAYSTVAAIPDTLTTDLTVATVAAFLFRFTEQEQLRIHLTIDGSQSAEATIPMNITMGTGSSLKQIADQVRLSLDSNGHTGIESRNAASNIAIEFSIGEFRNRTIHKNSELAFQFATTTAGTMVRIGYRTALFAEASISRLLQSLLAALQASLGNMDIDTGTLPILNPHQVDEIIASQGETGWAAPTTPIHELFAQWARLKPEALVATSATRRLTYGELNILSGRLAHHLIALGVAPNVPVAVCIHPSVDILVALLAIHRAGGIYLPLDPTHPESLINVMLDEAKPRALLSHSTVELAFGAGIVRFNLDTDWKGIEQLSDTPPHVEVAIQTPAYLLYTSGTTGKPKGVLATHGNLLHFIGAAQQRHGLMETDVFCSIARFTFSISLFDLASPLYVGARVHILARAEVLALDKLCAALQRVTVLHAGPSLLASLFRYLRSTANAPTAFPNIRHASTGGDLAPPSVVQEMARVFPAAELFILYGCTEISCMGTTFEINRQQPMTRNLVGKPYPNVVVRVLDEQQNMVPFGVVGEIYFAGNGIANGYFDKPELTHERFVILQGQRFYRTGDLGRVHTDGNLEILGRNDFQVQLRGMRVEPTGVENLVRELDLADECAVVLKRISDNDERLVAYVVKPKIDLAEFRKRVAIRLPDYMIPQHFIALSALPVTTNGKLNRRHLTEMPLELGVSANGKQPPATATEVIVADIFCKLLGVAEINIHDDFFELGGHSLLAVVATQQISERLQVTLPPHTMFECATVKFVAERALNGGAAETRAILLNSPMPGQKLFLLGGVHTYREYAKRLEGKCEAYGVFADKEANLYADAIGEYSVKQLASDYIEIIKRTQPHGPYFLLGYSFTGIVAYEVAQQLTEAGEEVRYLVLVDAVIPEWHLGWKFRVSQLQRALSISPRVLFNYLLWRLRSDRELKLEADDSDARLFFGINPHMRVQDRPLLDPLDLKRVELNAKTSGDYVAHHIKPYRGSVALIMSTDRLRLDPLKSPTGGWSHYLVKPFDLCNVDADHMHILESEPYATQTTEFIMAGLRRAQR